MLAVQPAYRKFLQSAGSLQLYRDLQVELADNTQEVNSNAVHPATSGEIEFNNDTVSYPGQAHNALTKVSFKVSARKTIALVGPSGSGKSTIANLICRIYDIESGDILLGENKLENLNLELLRKAIGYVPQDGYLFSGTIEENISFGSDEISEEEIKKVAATAEITSDILRFPEKYKKIFLGIRFYRR